MKTLFRFALLSLSLAVRLASAAPLAWQEYTYVTHDSAKTRVSGQVARLVVAEDPTKPDGAKVELALMRLRATTKAPGSPIVYLHGGPGGSSLEHLESPDFRAFFAALQARADVILLDQRGCGKSTPSLIPVRSAPVPAMLASREKFLATLTDKSAVIRDQLLKAGHEPRHFNTAASAEDLEALRAALGVPGIDLFAHSYGTQLAQAFMRAHPASVGRAVLVGSRGMDTSRKSPAQA